MRNTRFLFAFTLILSIGPLALAVAQPGFAAGSAQRTTSVVKTHPSQGPVQVVEGATATLVTNDNGASMTLQTSQLAPGHAYTIWWVAINNPAACATRPCSGADVLGNTAAVQAEVTYAAGHVVGDSGQGAFAGQLPAGDVVPGGWFGNGFTNPRVAEIHLVLHDHGPMIPDLVANQISTLRGGCTDASVPAAYPPIAKADGIPGPNTCRLVQFAVFQQQP